jgi:hypothetical protein
VADVGVLFLCPRATLYQVLAAAHALTESAGDRRLNATPGNRFLVKMRNIASILSLRVVMMLTAVALGLTSCQTIRHHFLDPSRDWQARNGQLLYKGQKTRLIGEVLVRFSKKGDFELTFTKGPGIALLEVRQDANFASVKGPLARGSWSGSTAQAPARLRGWLQLREVLMTSGAKTSVSHSAGNETFIFRF